MAIIEYIPPIKQVIDRRNAKGDYYKASCDVCGTEFYPKRRNAKYCTPNCKVIQFRIDVANGKVPKEIQKPSKISNSRKSGGVKNYRGAKNVYKFLKETYETRGQKDEILDGLKSLDFDEIFTFGKHKISKISPLIFEVK